ncbi:MAG TPA: hypothetical protein VIR00_12450 [Micromonosporaceae bacterium]|jgi:hypothetical protein
MTDIAVVLDTSALLGYIDGHVAVGELIAEVADEERLIAVPAVCFAQARAAVDDDVAAAHLLLLTSAPTITIEPLGFARPDGAESIWRVGEIARTANRDIGLGHAAYAAIDHRAHLATMWPHAFAALLPADWSILDLR